MGYIQDDQNGNDLVKSSCHTQGISWYVKGCKCVPDLYLHIQVQILHSNCHQLVLHIVCVDSPWPLIGQLHPILSSDWLIITQTVTTPLDTKIF